MEIHGHVLHVIDGLAPGGAERMVVEIANATDSRLFRVSICVTRSDLTLAAHCNPQVKVTKLGRKRTFDLAKFRKFATLCGHEAVTVIHAHGWYSGLFVSTMRMLFPSLRKIGFIFHDHYGDVEIHPHLPTALRIALRWIQPYYAAVHPRLAELAVQAGLKSSRAFVIRNAIDFQPYTESVLRETAQDSFLSKLPAPAGVVVANLRPSKNILGLIEALAALTEDAWSISIVGGEADPVYAQTCYKFIEQAGLSDRVRFIGPRLDVPELLPRFDFAVMPSISESGPLVLIEYAAAGLPFAASRVGLIAHEMAEGGVPGFVQPGDPTALAREISVLIALSEADRKIRGEVGQFFAVARYSIQNVIPEWQSLYMRASW